MVAIGQRRDIPEDVSKDRVRGLRQEHRRLQEYEERPHPVLAEEVGSLLQKGVDDRLQEVFVDY